MLLSGLSVKLPVKAEVVILCITPESSCNEFLLLVSQTKLVCLEVPDPKVVVFLPVTQSWFC